MKRNFYLAIALLLVVGMIVTGCQTAAPTASATTAAATVAAATSEAATTAPAPTTEPTATPLAPVTLNWYFPDFGGAFTDLSKITAELNKLTQAKISASIVLNAIPYADYETKMNVMTASSDNMDIVWTSSWCFNYSQNVLKGTFAPLDDLLASTPDLKATMPDTIWNASKVQGKIYAVPSDQIMATRMGLTIQKRWIDKYKVDVSTIKSLKDIEPLLAQLKANEPGIIPYGVYELGSIIDQTLYGGPDYTSYYTTDPTCKLQSLYFTPEYKAYAQLMRSWFQKGYIAEDTAIAKFADVEKTGNIAVRSDVTLKPGGEVAEKAANGGNDVVYIPFNTPVLGSPEVTMNAILQSSPNKDRAILFLQMVNTDSGVFNLIANGIEGTNYTKIDTQYIKPVDKSAYAPNEDWVFGNQFLGYLKEGMAADVWEQTKKVNESAIVTPLNGFSFDETSVKSELANLNAVYAQYVTVLNGGAVDPDKVLPEFQSKMKAAGIDAVVAEAQKQVDAYIASKK